MKELTRDEKIFLAGFETSWEWFNWDYVWGFSKSGFKDFWDYLWYLIKEDYEKEIKEIDSINT